MDQQRHVKLERTCTLFMRDLAYAYTRRRFLASGIAAASLATIPLLAAQPSIPVSSLQFRNKEYFFRWSNNKLFEFTPQDQADLAHWIDMFSVLAYREVKMPEALQAEANALIRNYKLHGAVFRTSSTPATSEKPTEYFVAGMLGTEGLVEGVFNRFVLSREIGYNLIYSHRIYGKILGENAKQMAEWAKSNGAEIEKALMALAPVPTLDLLQKERASGTSK
jgi:hypothetical protein